MNIEDNAEDVLIIGDPDNGEALMFVKKNSGELYLYSNKSTSHIVFTSDEQDLLIEFLVDCHAS